MEPNISSQTAQPVPEIQTPVTQTIQATPNNSSSKTKYILLSVFILLIIFLVGGGAYLLGVNKNSSSQKNTNLIAATSAPSPTLTPVPTIQPSPTSSLNSTANWKTYTSTLEGLSFKYPNEWTLDKIDCVNNITQQKAECAQLQSPKDKNGIPIIINYQYNDSGRKYTGAKAVDVKALSIPKSKKPFYLITVEETGFGTSMLGLYDKSIVVGAAVPDFTITSQTNSPLLVSMIAYLQKGVQQPMPYPTIEFKSHPYYNDALAIFESLSY